MPASDRNQVVKNLEHRMDRIDQILPTLATKADLHEQIAAVRTELLVRIHEGNVETRRHMDVVGESLRDEIRLLAEGIIANQERIDAERVARERAEAGLDRRVTRLEAARRPRRK